MLLKSLVHGPLTEAAPAKSDAAVAELAARVDQAARRRLGRTLAIREVDAGSCNGCELEIHALNNVLYDLERFGLRFVASPRHADVLLVTGPVTTNMREALERTYHATPDPKWVVAVGDCARDAGMFAGSYACVGGVATVVPVDLHIPACAAGDSVGRRAGGRPPKARGTRTRKRPEVGTATLVSVATERGRSMTEERGQAGVGMSIDALRSRRRIWYCQRSTRMNLPDFTAIVPTPDSTRRSRLETTLRPRWSTPWT
jgi:Ni,Fe-hydrogenase III small subunit